MKYLSFALAAFVLGSLIGVGIASADAEVEEPNEEHVHRALRGIGVPFVENEGLHPTKLRFHAETFGGTFFVTDDGHLRLAVRSGSSPDEVVLIEQSWLGAHPTVLRGVVRSNTVVRTSIGPDPSKWQQNAPAFDVVSLGDIYDGIELRLRAHGNNVEQLYFLAPGADPGLIQARIDGIDATSVDSQGQLILDTNAGPVTFTAPIAYQEIDGTRREVDVAYELTEQGYRFRLGAYDPSKALVIDPLLQATYVGGTGSESVNALFVHPDNGDVYIAGGTTSTTFGIDDTVLASSNAYIARLDPDLTEFGFIQYMGGLGSESITHVALHPAGSPRAGQMVVMGPSNSDNWPAAGYGTRGNDSLFVGIFNTALQPDFLRWVSGSVNDRPTALAIHPATYDVYIAGETNSDDFPLTAGGIQEARAGLYDAFVARLRPDLSAMVQATYLGGYSGGEVEVALAIDPTHGVYIRGRTNSGSTVDDNWPTELMASLEPPVDTPQPEFGAGIEDLFVGLLNAELTVPTMVTYLGGDGIEESRARIVVHPTTGRVYITGQTKSEDNTNGVPWSPGIFVACYSPTMDELEAFTVLTAGTLADVLLHSSGKLYVLGTTGGGLPADKTENTVQPDFGGGLGDGFVASYNLDPDLALERATYLGGSDREGGQAFLEHPDSGALYVTGYTHSTDYPRTAGGAQSGNRGFQEGFVARLAADLSTAAESQSTYYGGTNSDWSRVLAVDPDLGDVYIAGVTDSNDLLGMDGGAQPDSILDPEVFVALFDSTLAGGAAPEIDVVPPSYDFGQVSVGSRSNPVEFTIRNVGTADLIIQSISNSDPTNFVVVANGGSNGCSAARPIVLVPDASCTFTVEFVPSESSASQADVTIESNDLDEGELKVPLSGAGVGESGDSGGGGCDAATASGANSAVLLVLLLGVWMLAWRRMRTPRR